MALAHMRGPFLEYLRNLTPQVLLFSVLVIMVMRLDLNTFDLANFGPTFVTVVVFFVLLSAFIANASMFFENSCRSLDWVEKKIIRLRKRGIKGKHNLRLVFFLAWRTSKFFVVEFAVVLIVIHVGYFAVGMATVQAATGLYKSIRAN